LGSRDRTRLILVAIGGVLISLLGYRFHLVAAARVSSRSLPAQRFVQPSTSSARVSKASETPPASSASNARPLTPSYMVPDSVREAEPLLLWSGFPGLLAGSILRKRIFKKP
jgi:hypothetical protein